MPSPDRRIWRPSMVAGSRIAVGRGARYTHRELTRMLDVLSWLGYTLALVLAMTHEKHEQRANAIANAIVLAGALLERDMIYETSEPWRTQ